ncbi:V-type ATP synthase subunit E [Candidatus Solincola tengchongensis]|uniref:V-type ATP synthase subunit E n=1 Tax=Candidatus Solincola tengchongensis TaxID=2900693 RepID=UPI002579B0D2|nr:V-type ATP synthase subunit E [Candidatus Solincola tengchongensis]
MSLEKLLEKIEEDARKESRRLLAEAEEEAARIRREAEEEARREADEIRKSYRMRAEGERLKILSRARLEGRMDLLAAKEGLLDEVVREAGRRFRELPEEEYGEWLRKAVLSGVVNGDEVLTASPYDRRLLEGGLLQEINRELSQAGKKGELSLSPEDAPFDRGVILRGRGLEVNLSVEALLQKVWEESEEAVSRLLFGPE